jgi:hypothetical protein
VLFVLVPVLLAGGIWAAYLGLTSAALAPLVNTLSPQPRTLREFVERLERSGMKVDWNAATNPNTIFIARPLEYGSKRN